MIKEFDKAEDFDTLVETSEHMKTKQFMTESAFKDYISALKRHKTAVMDTDTVPKQVEELKAKLDSIILAWIEEQNPQIVALVSAQPEADTEQTQETASGLRKAYGALVNFNVENDLAMARTKAKVVVQDIKREIILNAIDEISSKYTEI